MVMEAVVRQLSKFFFFFSFISSHDCCLAAAAAAAKEGGWIRFSLLGGRFEEVELCASWRQPRGRQLADCVLTSGQGTGNATCLISKNP